MNHCAIQQNVFSAYEEARKDHLVCPKPRRLALLNTAINEPIRPVRWHFSHQAEPYDSKAGADLMEIILAKGGYGAEQPSSAQIASSPPFFCGSPPSRVANPLIQDARFGDEKLNPISPSIVASPGQSSSPSSSSRKGGCVRANFGDKPAMRVEGFDCMKRDDRRNRSIPALA